MASSITNLLAIIPYFILLVVYVYSLSPHKGRAPELLSSVFLKVLPVWYLAIFTIIKHFNIKRNTDINKKGDNSFHGNNEGIINSSSTTYGISNVNHRLSHTQPSEQPSEGHLDNKPFQNGNGVIEARIDTEQVSPPNGQRFVVGLLISSVGDACLVYTSLFKLGILAFGIAQLMYLLALKHRHIRSRLAWIAVPLCFLIDYILFPGVDETILKILVLGYSILIHAMLFYAIAGWESFPSLKSTFAMLGAFIFIGSDFLIAVNKWVTATPYAEASILSTYYTAQLLLTLGIC